MDLHVVAMTGLLQTTRLYIKRALGLDVSIQIGLHARSVGELRIEIHAGLEILGDQFRILHRGAYGSPEIGLAIRGRPLRYDCKSDDEPLVFISPSASFIVGVSFRKLRRSEAATPTGRTLPASARPRNSE